MRQSAPDGPVAHIIKDDDRRCIEPAVEQTKAFNGIVTINMQRAAFHKLTELKESVLVIGRGHPVYPPR